MRCEIIVGAKNLMNCKVQIVLWKSFWESMNSLKYIQMLMSALFKRSFTFFFDYTISKGTLRNTIGILLWII